MVDQRNPFLVKIIYNTVVLVLVVFPFLATLLAILLLWEHAVDWLDLALLAIMYTLTAFGVTIGFHRMATHRSFQPHPVVKFVLLVLGTMAFQSPPIRWAAVHTKHHANSDREGDPHSPLQGFFFAHMTWLFGEGMLQAPAETYCGHLLKDRIVVFVDKTSLVWMALGLLIPFLLGGWTG